MGNFIIDLLNGIIQDLADVIQFILNLLPPSPFSLLNNSPIGQYLPSINWIFPIETFVNIAEAWLTAIAIYYAYSIVMRWIKAIN